jgi:hypothetical protein
MFLAPKLEMFVANLPLMISSAWLCYKSFQERKTDSAFSLLPDISCQIPYLSARAFFGFGVWVWGVKFYRLLLPVINVREEAKKALERNVMMI